MKFLKEYITFFFLFFVFQLMESQVKSLGFPEIRNFKRTEYKGETQNWNIDQDQNGNMYFANNSGGTLVVSDLNDLLEEDDVIVGDYSNATYTINTVDLNPLKTVAIVTVPDPVSANSDEDFGFTETITEFPSTLT